MANPSSREEVITPLPVVGTLSGLLSSPKNWFCVMRAERGKAERLVAEVRRRGKTCDKLSLAHPWHFFWHFFCISVVSL